MEKFLFFLILLLNLGCNRSEENEDVFKSKQEQILGKWNLVEIKTNSDFGPDINTCPRIWEFEFKKNQFETIYYPRATFSGTGEVTYECKEARGEGFYKITDEQKLVLTYVDLQREENRNVQEYSVDFVNNFLKLDRNNDEYNTNLTFERF